MLCPVLGIIYSSLMQALLLLLLSGPCSQLRPLVKYKAQFMGQMKTLYMHMVCKTINLEFITSMHRQVTLSLGMHSMSNFLHLLAMRSNICKWELRMLSFLLNNRAVLRILMLFMQELFLHQELNQLKLQQTLQPIVTDNSRDFLLTHKTKHLV